MHVRVLAFARLRELLGGGVHDLEIAAPATAASLWNELERRTPGLAEVAESTRIARNGRVVSVLSEELADGDELALLPPVGGG